MPLLQQLRKMGGVARTRYLEDQGHSRYAIACAIEREQLLRIRKGWVCLPDADPQLQFAAKHNVVLSCITQARRLGLWVYEEDKLHVAARHPNGTVTTSNACVHWNALPMPRGPDALVDPLGNVMTLVLKCQPREHAVAIIESALNKKMTSIRALKQLPLSREFREIVQQCRPYSDSGLETYFRERLRWLRVRIRTQVHIEGHRTDILIGNRLIVQIDGAHHVGPQRTSDNRHDVRLMLNGYNVMRFSYYQVMHAWEEVHEAIIEAVAQGLHLRAAA